MNSYEIISYLKKLNKPVFSINDLSRLTKKDIRYNRLLLHRLATKKLIKKIEKGKYTFLSDVFEISSNLILQSYISLLSAYYIYNLTEQIPSEITIITTKIKKAIEIEKTKIIFVKINKKRFFGYKKISYKDSYIIIAEPEKAILDSLYLIEKCPLSETFNALKNLISENKLDLEKLLNYSFLVNSSVVFKRLGYLLDNIGIDVYNKFKNKLTKKYDMLNPLKKAKKKSKKWFLLVSDLE